MTYPTQEFPPQPPKSRRGLKITLIVAGSLLGVLLLCCVASLIVNAVVGPLPKTKTAAAPATTSAVRSLSTSAPSAAPSSSAPATSSPPAPKPTTIPPSPTATTDPGREICSFVEGGGIYYLLVTSETAYNLSACDGGTRYPGTIDDLLLRGPSGMDRRCILPDSYTAAHEAIVGVYSDTRRADLAAARAFCQANGGTN